MLRTGAARQARPGRAAFWITDRDGLVSLLKLLPGPASAGLGWWHELAGTLGRLRDRGYPAPRLLKIAQLGGRPFWIQERMAGAALAPAGRPVLIARLLPELLRTAITGVVDIDPPTLAGDRAFDVATLLFYLYDLDAIRGRLWTRLLELAGRDTAREYLAHMVLRQVDWSLRFHPAAATTTQHLRLARRVLADIA